MGDVLLDSLLQCGELFCELAELLLGGVADTIFLLQLGDLLQIFFLFDIPLFYHCLHLVPFLIGNELGFS